MRLQQRGWRTARSRGAQVGILHPVTARPAPAAPAAPVANDAPDHDLASGMPWQGVSWSLALVGLLAYMWTIITYRIQLGQPGMIVALIGVGIMSASFRFPAFMSAMLAFLAWCALGYFMSPWPGVVADGLEVLGKLFLIALVIVNVLRDRRTQRFFMFVFLAAFAMYPVRGAIFNYLGGYTVFGRAIWNYAYANPNDLAAFTLLALGVTAALYVREPKGWPKLAALVGLALLPLVILLTQSRGGLLALAVFGLGALSLQPKRKRWRAAGGVLLIALIAAPLAPDSVWERMSGLRNATDTGNLRDVDKEGSAEQRFEFWKIASTVIRENPVAGVGLNAYPEANAVTSLRAEFKPMARGKRDAHSTYLTVAAETGFVGLALFAGIFVLVMAGANRTRRRARDLLPNSAQQLTYLQLGLLAFFIAGIFGSFALLSFLYISAAVLWAITHTVRDELDSIAAGGAGITPAPTGRRPT